MLHATAFAALLAACGAAYACGVCVEDKVASTYDHALVARSVAAGHHVAFFHVDGPLVKDEATRRALLAAVEAAPGVDKGSARVALDTLALSFAFDPRRGSLVAAQNAIDRRIAARRLSLFPMRVIERPAELKPIAR
jgi:hypothetical protein